MLYSAYRWVLMGAISCSDESEISRKCMKTALAWYIILGLARERYATVADREITR
jgi:hypothetical protein